VSRDLRPVGALEMLDRAFHIARRAGGGFVARSMTAGLCVAAAVIGIYYLEEVEGVRGVRPLLAAGLVVAWWARTVLLSGAAREAAQLLWDGVNVPPGAGRAIDAVRLGSVVGLGLWVWMWILAGALLVGPIMVAFVWPLLCLRGGVAPSWLARAGCTADGGFRGFARAFADGAGRRGHGIAIELLILLGSMILYVNLFGLLAVVSLLGRSMLGLDLAVLDSFLSFENPIVVLGVAAAALVVLEPLRAAVSALLYVDAQVRKEGLDLRAMLELAREAAARRSPGAGGGASAVTRTAAALLLAVSVFSGRAAAQPGEDYDPFDPYPPVDPYPAEVTPEPPPIPEPPPVMERAGTPEDMANRERVHRILDRDEFREFDDRREKSVADLISQLFEWLARKLSEQPREAEAPGVSIPMPPGEIFLFLALVLLVGVAAYLIASRLRERSGDKSSGEKAAEVDPRERAPAEHLDDAATLAAQGRYREALRALYLATLVALDRKRLLTFDPTLTNWQYIRQMPRGEARSLFTSFTRLFDYKWYGDESTTEEDYRAVRGIASRICGPEEEAT
jgi:hypothetical protein